MSNLFSQIPLQVLNKVHGGITDKGLKKKETPKRRVKFYDEDDEIKPQVCEESDSTDVSEIFIVDDNTNEAISSPQKTISRSIEPATSPNEPTSSRIETPVVKESLNAIVQTDAKSTRNIGTQTEEEWLLIMRSMNDPDIHRNNMQSYAPIMPIPKRKAGSEPPLRIGLTLRGKKRRVFYPDEAA